MHHVYNQSCVQLLKMIVLLQLSLCIQLQLILRCRNLFRVHCQSTNHEDLQSTVIARKKTKLHHTNTSAFMIRRLYSQEILLADHTLLSGTARSICQNANKGTCIAQNWVVPRIETDFSAYRTREVWRVHKEEHEEEEEALLQFTDFRVYPSDQVWTATSTLYKDTLWYNTSAMMLIVCLIVATHEAVWFRFRKIRYFLHSWLHANGASDFFPSINFLQCRVWKSP